MNDDVSGAPAASPFALRQVAPATAQERRIREEGMARALKHGAAPNRDAEGNARYVFFKEANNAPVEAWWRDPIRGPSAVSGADRVGRQDRRGEQPHGRQAPCLHEDSSGIP
jgi:hypothetical protein